MAAGRVADLAAGLAVGARAIDDGQTAALLARLRADRAAADTAAADSAAAR